DCRPNINLRTLRNSSTAYTFSQPYESQSSWFLRAFNIQPSWAFNRLVPLHAKQLLLFLSLGCHEIHLCLCPASQSTMDPSQDGKGLKLTLFTVKYPFTNPSPSAFFNKPFPSRAARDSSKVLGSFVVMPKSFLPSSPSSS